MAELIAHDFAATLISRDEHRSSYEVQGFVTCPTADYRIELAPTNEGIVPTPESAMLLMVVTAPDGVVAEVITEVPVSYAGRDGAQLQTIGIRLGDVRTSEGEKVIKLALDSS